MEKRIPQPARTRILIVTAEDYGYAPAYDAGILEAAAAGAVDSVSVLVLREGLDTGPLVATGVEVGLHLELPGIASWNPERATPEERNRAIASFGEQLARFERLFGRSPAYVDGHHHCHAAAGLASALARIAAERSLPMRSINSRHRRILRGLGVATPDRLVGRLRESEPALPEEIRRVLDGGALPPGVTQWMTHPGHPDPASGSGYDAGRAEDLALLLGLATDEGLARARTTWEGLIAAAKRRRGDP